ncbi:MAG: DUF5067 domain-containing protein [Actinomycetaceae bacterium]|nr:DUF5067 domain-containing protein [Actinomycetaceae bacterium]
MPEQNMQEVAVQPAPKKPLYKKPWFIILVVFIVIGIIAVASGGGDSSSSSASPSTSASAEAAKEKEVKTDYPTTVGEGVKAKDYEGKDAFVVTYEWTNNSNEATNFEVALSAKAYQNGVELEKAILSSDDVNYYEFKDVKNGAKQTVKVAYKLTDDSDVEVEVKEFISLNNDVIASKKFSLK